MNKDPDFFRNKIRSQLLPLLAKKYNANIQEIFVNLSKTVSVDYDYLRREAQKKLRQSTRLLTPRRFEFDFKKFQNHHPAIQRMMIRLAIKHLQGNTNRLTLDHVEHIEKLIEINPPAKTILALPKGLRCQRKEKRLIFLTARDNFKDL